jgi:DNA-binding IclR family transcriptional regulator
MLGPKEISKESKINNSTVKSCLGRMLKQEIVINKDGKYGLPGVVYAEDAGRW